MVMIAVETGTGIGCSVLLEKYFGASNKVKVKTGISTVLIFSSGILKEMSSFAAVSVVHQSITSVGMMIVQSAVDQFGSAATATSKIDSFSIMPFIVCGNATSTFIAQNIGALEKNTA